MKKTSKNHSAQNKQTEKNAQNEQITATTQEVIETTSNLTTVEIMQEASDLEAVSEQVEKSEEPTQVEATQVEATQVEATKIPFEALSLLFTQARKSVIADKAVTTTSGAGTKLSNSQLLLKLYNLTLLPKGKLDDETKIIMKALDSNAVMYDRGDIVTVKVDDTLLVIRLRKPLLGTSLQRKLLLSSNGNKEKVSIKEIMKWVPDAKLPDEPLPAGGSLKEFAEKITGWLAWGDEIQLTKVLIATE